MHQIRSRHYGFVLPVPLARHRAPQLNRGHRYLRVPNTDAEDRARGAAAHYYRRTRLLRSVAVSRRHLPVAGPCCTAPAPVATSTGHSYYVVHMPVRGLLVLHGADEREHWRPCAEQLARVRHASRATSYGWSIDSLSSCWYCAVGLLQQQHRLRITLVGAGRCSTCTMIKAASREYMGNVADLRMQVGRVPRNIHILLCPLPRHIFLCVVALTLTNGCQPAVTHARHVGDTPMQC